MIKVAPACAVMISTYEFGKTFFQERNLNQARCGLWVEREDQRFVQDDEEAERDSSSFPTTAKADDFSEALS